MAEKKNEPSFTVTDRRLFTQDGELRSDVPEEVEAPKAPAATASKAARDRTEGSTTCAGGWRRDSRTRDAGSTDDG